LKLTLIKPNIGRMEHSLYVDEGRMEPLQLGVLAGMTPADVDVVLHDDRCETIPYDDPTDLVALTVETFTARRAYEISAEYRSRGVPVVLGGFHPTLIPEEAARHGDAVVTGDAETVWSDVIEDARAGELRPLYRASAVDPQAGGVLPRRDIFEGKGYLPLSLVQFGRGCPNGCNYCAISAYFEATHTCRRVEEVVREIRALKRRTVFFVDDNIVANHKAARQLFRALVPLKIRWVSQGSVDMVDDRELMELMVESGCVGNVIGFESLDPEALREMNKSPNLHAFDSYERAVGILRGYGLQTWAAFLLGNDADTSDGLYRMLEFATRHKFTFAAYNVLMPYPSTPLYSKLEEEGRLLYDGTWWLHPEYRFNYAAYRPAKMSADELTETAFDIRRRWNSTGSIFKRFFDPRTNMRSPYRAFVYWAYNPLFQRETFKKQGMRFGVSKVGAPNCQ
jgi:radical SAM superfamily enzyme YgiQ (UPF0313 family)